MHQSTPEQILENTVRRCRERDIIIPTFEEMMNPERIPPGIIDELGGVGLWELHPRNLFRISWKNEPVAQGGGFGGVNFIELPPALTGVRTRILMLVGKYFPTGAHKVGATFAPLVERLVSGTFDPTVHKALWPSTGNYCRGGAYDAYLLACPSIAVLPEGMSRERFEWLEELGSEIHATPGSESNVKEVYDKTLALKAERPDEIVVLNQFEEFGNAMWHYACTGHAMEEVFLAAGRRGPAPGGCLPDPGLGRDPGLGGLPEGAGSRGSRWRPARPSSARPCSTPGTVSTVSRGSATSTSPGYTTCGIRMW